MIGAYMKCMEMSGNGVRIIGNSTRQNTLLIPRARNLAIAVFGAAARGSTSVGACVLPTATATRRTTVSTALAFAWPEVIELQSSKEQLCSQLGQPRRGAVAVRAGC